MEGRGYPVGGLVAAGHTSVDIDYDCGSTVPLTAGAGPHVRVWPHSRNSKQTDTDQQNHIMLLWCWPDPDSLSYTHTLLQIIIALKREKMQLYHWTIVASLSCSNTCSNTHANTSTRSHFAERVFAYIMRSVVTNHAGLHSVEYIFNNVNCG